MAAEAFMQTMKKTDDKGAAILAALRTYRSKAPLPESEVAEFEAELERTQKAR